MHQISSKVNKILENACKISFTPSSNSRLPLHLHLLISIKWKLYFELHLDPSRNMGRIDTNSFAPSKVECAGRSSRGLTYVRSDSFYDSSL